MKYTIEKDNVLIKDYIRNTLGLSAKTMIKLKPNGIFLNGIHARVVDFMQKGDILEIVQTAEEVKEYPTENIKLDILYEDDNLLLVNKAFAMPVYPAGQHLKGSLLSAFAYKYPNLVFRPIYRLDRNTSGIIAVAKNRMSVTVFDIFKTYIAVCQGKVPDSGEIKSAIDLEDGSKIKRITGKGKDAHTSYSSLAYDGKHSLVKLNIFTGRTHQIRVHMASIGFPLAGDDLYGGNLDYISRHALHCHEISIKSQTLEISQIVKASIPQDMLNAFPILFKENI